jgi:acyl carrier protein
MAGQRWPPACDPSGMHLSWHFTIACGIRPQPDCDPTRTRMTDQDRLAALTQILRDLLGDDSIALGMDTMREDVPGWDSFNYINFIVAVEAEYGIKFRIADIESFPNVGAIVHAIAAAEAR